MFNFGRKFFVLRFNLPRVGSVHFPAKLVESQPNFPEMSYFFLAFKSRPGLISCETAPHLTKFARDTVPLTQSSLPWQC